MKISTMASTSVPSARVRFIETRKSGLAEPVGRSFTWVASRSGRRMRDQRSISNGQWRMASFHHHDSGDVPAATCQRMFYLRLTLAGAKKKSTLAHPRAFPRTRVVRLAVNKGHCPRSVRTHANLSVMQGHVHLALTWGLCRFVSVARIRRLVDVSRPTTILDGAAERFVVTCYLVANMSVRDHATKGFVVLAKCLLQPGVIAERLQRTSYALIKPTRSTVENKA